MSVPAFKWQTNHLDVLDQRLLPHTVKNIRCETPADVAQAIKSMAVRGAPAIGCVAAYAMVLGAVIPAKAGIQVSNSALKKVDDLDSGFRRNDVARMLKAARPTAINLAWAVDRMLKKSHRYEDLLSEAIQIEKEDLENNRAMSRFGARLFKKGSVILTHCNAGALATAGIGTALGVIREVHAQGKLKKLFVDETRPYLQGARLTAWECEQDNIPYELITDSMAGHFMKTEKVSGVIVGCDRVAANGDTANKIGTYSLAVLAKYHKIPFYVAMPFSTLDMKLKTGVEIPIEERSSKEVVQIAGQQIAPLKTIARHPAFDVTPASLITAFVTEHGVGASRWLARTGDALLQGDHALGRASGSPLRRK